jgi:hypothetical protein
MAWNDVIKKMKGDDNLMVVTHHENDGIAFYSVPRRTAFSLMILLKLNEMSNAKVGPSI